jgi:hypothetical protein
LDRLACLSDELECLSGDLFLFGGLCSMPSDWLCLILATSKAAFRRLSCFNLSSALTGAKEKQVTTKNTPKQSLPLYFNAF